MTTLWQWPALCRALQIPEVEGPVVSGFDIDSRTLQPGDLFIALPAVAPARFQVAAGSGRNGHEFIAAARQCGAVGVMTDRETKDLPCLRVNDCYEGLWKIGAAARQRSAATFIAVTGSAGKTSFKTFLARALTGHASVKSFNNHLGVPLTLARTPSDSRFAVVEVGTNHSGELAPLSAMVAPHVAVLLNVLPAHIGNFLDFEALMLEKLSLQSGLQPGGCFVAPQALRERATSPLVLTFGEEIGADARVTHVAGDRAEIMLRGERWNIRIPGGGEHRALLCAAALAVSLHLGVPRRPFVEQLEFAEVPAGRGNQIEIAGMTLIDDSYNANPVSMALALRSLAKRPATRRIAILGEMLELGDEELSYHRGLASHCEGIDEFILIGSRMQVLAQLLGARSRWVTSTKELDLEELAGWLRPGDAVLVKGANRVFWVNEFVDRLVQRLRR